MGAGEKKQATQKNLPKTAPYWVVIGASAGGLEALKELLAGLKAETPAIYIVAQHLDPKHPTILKDLLARSTDLPVTLVEEDLKPEVGQVYIVSPGHNALVEKGRIHLKPAAAVGPKPSVNLLMTSLAEDQGEQAIGVILSGTGSDGAQGMMAIKSASGLALVQTENTAKYTGMPQAAKETGFVDLELAPGAMAEEIAGYIDSAGKALSKISVPKVKSNLEKIFQRILDQTGYDFSGYKLKTVQRRIARRMAVHKVVTLDDYLTLFLSSGKEVECLFKDLLISVTAFFRDEDAFKDLSAVVDQLVADTAEDQTLRVWVPGCANGEEAYSLAILFHEARSRARKEISFQIFATDIDEFALSLGRRGTFSLSQIKNIPEALYSRYFTERDGQYFVNKIIRDQVVFARQNVIMDPPFSRLDLISCRNLLIYFSTELQKQVFQTFHFALKPKGVLFLGRSESATSSCPELFDPLVKKSQIFVRKNTNLSQRVDQVASANSLAHSRQQRTLGAAQPLLQEKHQAVAQIDRMLLQELLPIAIVVDASGQVMHLRGEVSRYLSFPQGRIDTNILSLIRDDIKIDVRALLQKARREGSATTQALFYKETQAQAALFLSVKQVHTDQGQELYVLTFSEVDLSEAFISGTGLLDQEGHISNENLRKEIQVFKDRLQSSIEDLETTNEELQSTNEELQSANEELQSTNEELQTANEELQSTNEELSTVNQELEVKTYELEQVNNDLVSMLAKMNEVILLVDNRLRLQRYTAKASQLFDIHASDVGQTITTLGLSVDIPNLRQELLNVIEMDREQQLRVRKGADVFLLRLVPYKSDDTKVVGVMLFFENTGAYGHLNRDADSHRTLKLLGDYLPYSLMVIDEMGVITYVNRQIHSLLGFEPQDLLHENLKIIMPEPYSRHHDSYVQSYIKGQGHNLMGQWRDITALTKQRERKLLKIRVEETWINAERHFIGFLLAKEEAGDEQS